MTDRYDEDSVLGTVRRCPGCEEWWPFDVEFWHMDGERLSPHWPHRCIACCAEYYAARRAARTEAAA